MEDTPLAIEQIRNSPELKLYVVCGVIAVAGFNFTGLMITKYASSAQRATIDTCRTLAIWAVFLSLGREQFKVGQLIGFILLLAGTLVYNEIVEIPIDFMNQNTKRNLLLKEEASKSLIGKETPT